MQENDRCGNDRSRFHCSTLPATQDHSSYQADETAWRRQAQMTVPIVDSDVWSTCQAVSLATSTATLLDRFIWPRIQQKIVDFNAV